MSRLLETEPIAEIVRVLEEMVAQQRARVLVHARRLNAKLTDDDVQQPHDFPELAGSPEWNYEDGILAGYQAVQAAVRATLRKLE
jgi:hypothetical protein